MLLSEMMMEDTVRTEGNIGFKYPSGAPARGGRRAEPCLLVAGHGDGVNTRVAVVVRNSSGSSRGQGKQCADTKAALAKRAVASREEK